MSSATPVFVACPRSQDVTTTCLTKRNSLEQQHEMRCDEGSTLTVFRPMLTVVCYFMRAVDTADLALPLDMSFVRWPKRRGPPLERRDAILLTMALLRSH